MHSDALRQQAGVMRRQSDAIRRTQWAHSESNQTLEKVEASPLDASSFVEDEAASSESMSDASNLRKVSSSASSAMFSAPYLMRDAIRGTQRQSEAISGN